MEINPPFLTYFQKSCEAINVTFMEGYYSSCTFVQHCCYGAHPIPEMSTDGETSEILPEKHRGKEKRRKILLPKTSRVPNNVGSALQRLHDTKATWGPHSDEQPSKCRIESPKVQPEMWSQVRNGSSSSRGKGAAKKTYRIFFPLRCHTIISLPPAKDTYLHLQRIIWNNFETIHSHLARFYRGVIET